MLTSTHLRLSSVMTLTASIALAWALPASPAAADTMTALVPAYFYPGEPGLDWTTGTSWTPPRSRSP